MTIFQGSQADNLWSRYIFLHIMWTLSLLLLYDMLRCAGTKLNCIELNLLHMSEGL